jgi:hypothetical protein
MNSTGQPEQWGWLLGTEIVVVSLSWRDQLHFEIDLATTVELFC